MAFRLMKVIISDEADGFGISMSLTLANCQQHLEISADYFIRKM
jgi:hypothetical protein